MINSAPLPQRRMPRYQPFAAIALLNVSLAASLPAGAQSTSADGVAAGRTDELEEIIITGTRLRGVEPIGSDVVTVSRAALESTAVVSTNQLLNTIPQLGNFNQSAGRTILSSGLGSEGPNIHAIPNGTLVLMNGHRFAGAGITSIHPDPGIIPLLAIDRVEIVADGASSIYGSDAVAGVVNFITRSDLDGFEANASYAVDGLEQFSAGAAVGTDWGPGSAMIAYEFQGHDELMAGQRSYTGLDQTARGGGDYRAATCTPGTATVGAQTYPAPYTTPGAALLCDYGGLQSLLPDEERHSVFATLRHELNDRVELFGEAYFSRKIDGDFRPSFGSPLTIDGSSPFYIQIPGTLAGAAQSVTFNPGTEFGQTETSRYRTRSRGVVLGTDLRVFDDFNLALMGNFSWEDDSKRTLGIDVAALQAATTAGTLNPYGIGPANDAGLLPGFIIEIAADRTSSEIREFQAVLDGPLFELPAGEVKIAVGSNIRDEQLEQSQVTPTVTLNGGGERTQLSFFGELYVPLLSSLELSASVRHDDYDDVGETTNPKVGINFKPVEDVKFRASYGSSFLAPNLGDLQAVDTRIQPVPPIFGPALGNLIILAGGNPDLEPQTADIWTAGFDFTPRFVPDLTVSATYFDVDYTDLISIPGINETIFCALGLPGCDPGLRAQFTINPTQAQIDEILNSGLPLAGPVFAPVGTIFDFRRNNLGTLKVGGVDFDINYRLATGSASALVFGLSGTRYTKFESAVTPASPLLDVLARRPNLNARASVGWLWGNFSSMVFLNHTAGYDNVSTTPAQEVDSFNSVDLHLAYDLQGKFADNIELVLSVSNLFDEEPPFYDGPTPFTVNAGFNGDYASIFGRIVTLGTRIKL